MKRPDLEMRPGGGSPADEALDALVSILDEIRSARSRSRAEIVSRTGLSRGVVAQRVSELVALGIVDEGDVGPSTGGRPPRRMRFRADAGHVLVADIGATSIDVAVTDLDGRILGHRDEPADVAAGPERCLERVAELFSELTTATRDLPGRLWGIGIGVPGPVEFRSGRPVSPPIMPGWDGYPVRERFVRYDAPVWVDNDVNLLALGEWRSGIAVGHDNVVVMKIGTGIGAGIISNGRLHRGAQGSAGDVGHIQVVDNASIVCRCGNVGCLEALAGGAALARDGEAAAMRGRSAALRKAQDQHGGALTAEDIARAASFGDPTAISLLQGAGHRVGLVLASLVNFFNPSLIVIGGGVAQSGDVLLAAIRETVYRRSLPLATRDLLVKRSSLGSLAGVIGASSMVVEQLFSREAIAEWLASPNRPAAFPMRVGAEP